MPAVPDYPFVPKSNRYLLPGQFWSLPLHNGRFACGRVMAVPAFGARDRVGIVIGLMDWVGNQPPTFDSLQGCQVLVQAETHFSAITNTGGDVLGLRPLDLDGLIPVDPNDLSVGSIHLVWGRATISDKAEERFG